MSRAEEILRLSGRLHSRGEHAQLRLNAIGWAIG